MIRLRLLGPLSLERDDDVAVRSVLAQPKRLALLAYLAAVHPPALRRRDTLLGLFWPESDTDRARTTLRQTLYQLRRSLGTNVLLGKGDDSVGVDPERLWCDAAAFDAAVAEDRPEAALELHRGPFMEGFHLSGAPAFERWMAGERRRRRLQALEAAWGLAEGAEVEDPAAARRWAERALGLAPYDGETLRRYLLLMDRLGQPAAAVRAYEAYEARLQEDLELAPSEETTALVTRIRDGDRARPAEPRGPAGTADGPRPGQGEESLPVGSEEPATTGIESGQPRGTSSSSMAPSAASPADEDRSVPVGSSRPSSRASRPLLAVTAALLLAAGVGTVWYVTGGGDRSEVRDRSVAVLPFETLGQTEATAFTEGIQTGVQSRLSSISGLSVKSRTSVMRYRNSESSIADIARELGVTWILRGEVQESGGQVQVTSRLVNARRDEQAWSDTYRHSLTVENLFRVQEEITKRIARELQTQLSAREKSQVEARPTASLAAYELFVRGRVLLEQRTEDEIRQAASLFERALTRDSSFALAWAGLSDARSLLWFYGYAPEDSVSSGALRAARRAVELDPGSGVTHASLGIVRSLRHEGPLALEHLERAVELQPGYSEAQIWLSWVHLMLGRSRRALPPAREAVRLDPLAPAMHIYVGEAYLARDSLEEALSAARRAREIQPDYALAHYLEGLVLLHLDRLAEADSALRRAREISAPRGTPSPAEIDAALAVTRVAAGDTSGARSHLREIEAAGDSFSAGLVRAAVGDRDGAFSAFRRTEEWDSPRIEIIRYYFPGVLGPLREDPQFGELIGKVNRAWGLQPDESVPSSTS